METLLPQASLRDIALVLFKRKWSIAFVMAATMAAFLAWMFFIRDDLYKVSCKVLVKIGREQAPPPSVMGATPLVIAYRSQDVNSEIEIFTRQESIAQVVDELHLDRPTVEPVPSGFFARSKYEVKRVMKEVKEWYEEALILAGLRERLSPREKVIYGLQLGLGVRPQKDSNVFVAELLLPYRRGSAAVLNALLDHYLEARQGLYQTKELDFFKASAADTSAKLRDAERRIQEFENQGGIAEIGKQQSILIDHIASARAAWAEADYTRQEFAARVARLEKELAKADPDFAGIGEFAHEGFQQTVLKQLADLQRERERLRMTELDSSDRITNNRQQFAALANMLAANVRTALAEREQQTRLRREAYDRLQAQLQQLHDKQMEWVDLKRKTRDYEDSYLLYRKKLEEATADSGMQERQIGNAAVIERAADPLAPAGMRKTMLLALAVIASLLAALTWVTIAEFFDHKVYTVEALQRRVPAPVFAVIPAARRLESLTKSDRYNSTSFNENRSAI
jgi:uncharacterized protein involved in exopolysaccharide biosynthesis